MHAFSKLKPTNLFFTRPKRASRTVSRKA